MVLITCSRSGLVFEAENKRTKIHPGISWYTAHRDTAVRYPAVAVIERGKTEGWDSIAKFKSEIEKALNPVPDPEPDWDLSTSDSTTPDGYGKAKKGYIAKIVGSDSKFRYKREFLTEVKKDGRHRYFKLVEDGVYQACSYSAKGNKHESWYQVVAGERVEITAGQVEDAFPPVSSPNTETVEQIVEECWECGATYATYGNVEAGNMGCRRCG